MRAERGGGEKEGDRSSDGSSSTVTPGRLQSSMCGLSCAVAKEMGGLNGSADRADSSSSSPPHQPALLQFFGITANDVTRQLLLCTSSGKRQFFPSVSSLSDRKTNEHSLIEAAR